MNLKDCDQKNGITRRTFLKQTAQTAAVLTAAGSLPIFHPVAAIASADRDFDVLIKGGTVYDGTLKPPRVADIGIKGGRITAIGDLAGAAKIIDARGLAVTPGFIDVHTHCDMTFMYMNPLAVADAVAELKGNYNYIYQGVTTVVTGNCGMGVTDTAKWLGMARTMSFGANVLHLAPHGAIRAELFGPRQPSQLSPDQLETFKRRIAEEMEKGAVGLSTGLEYSPGLLAQPDELIELAKVAARYGRVYTTHMRDESGKIHKDGKHGVIASLQEAVDLCRKAAIPVEISHLKIMAPRNDLPVSRILAVIEQARNEGLDITADQYPYDAASTYLTYLIPNRFKAPNGGVAEAFKTDKGRREIRAAVEETFTYLPPEKTLIAWFPGHAEFEGKTLKDIAEMEGKSASECYAEIVSGRICPYGIYFGMDMATVKAIATRDYVMTGSDGSTAMMKCLRPHPRYYGTFPRKLRQFAIDHPLMTLPAAIRSMTSLPAEKFRIKQRGKIAEGFHADIAVIDLNAITDHATFMEPHQYATGVRHLMVNGVVAISDGQATGSSGGEALRQ